MRSTSIPACKSVSFREKGVFHTAEISVSVRYNVSINSVVHRQTAVGIGSFPAAWHSDRRSEYSQSLSHHSCSSTIQRLPHWLSCLASYRTNCLQHVESMRTHGAKISDRVAEFQEALSSSVVPCLNGSFIIGIVA